MLTIHVVSHTHWDREWYHTAERFRQRLVALVDELLDTPPDKAAPFLLDGQAVVLEDYLAVRPERASELSSALREGRLDAGPWYVLADELIPGSEGLIRNLLAGTRVLGRLRATSPAVLYCPDSFGHPASLPALARGFGKDLVILWRGLGSGQTGGADTIWWTAPNGERVLVYHLTSSGYELGANLPGTADEASARWQRTVQEYGERPVTGHALLLNGADHHARQDGLEEAVRHLAAAAGDSRVRATGIGGFSEALSEAARALDLGGIAGELRNSHGYTWTLQGTLGTRAHLKRGYASAERTLVRDVEPWAALAAMQSGRSLRHLVNAAWQPVLLCQPHDTLCGCSIDAVAHAVRHRLSVAGQEAVGLREIATHTLLGHDPVAARNAPGRWQPMLTIRNAAPRRRSGVAMVRLTLKLADVPVGPGSTHVDVGRARASLRQTVQWPVDEPVQVLHLSTATERVESPRDYPDNDAVAHFDAAVWMDDVPGYGIAALPFGERAAASPVNLVETRGRSVTNGRLTLRWDAAGRLSVQDHGTGRTVGSLVAWESRRDLGDLYTPALRQRKLVPRFQGTRVLHRGPLRAVIEQQWRLVKRQEHVDVRVQLTLDANAPFLRFKVIGDNAARDHRLRFLVRTDVADGVVVADAALGPVERTVPTVSAKDAAREQVATTAPLHRYVSRFDGERGATLYSDGLAEYEAMRNGFAVTLVRAVGELSKSNLPERPGHAGWPAPTPEAQSLGPFEAEFALLLHGARDAATIDAIERTSDDVLLPLVGETLRSAMRAVPPVHGVVLEGRGLAFGCVKESEDGAWTVLRCVNLLDEATEGSWQLGGMIREARLARLDETPEDPMEAVGDRVRFRARPRDVVTILVR
jgi:mannosylglycerate hydrolase